MHQTPIAPEAPMIIEGGVLPGDPGLMLRCMLEELLGGGQSTISLRAMAQDPNYQALHAARAVLGDATFERLIAETAARVGVAHCCVQETPATEFPAELTISRASDATRGGASHA